MSLVFFGFFWDSTGLSQTKILDSTGFVFLSCKSVVLSQKSNLIWRPGELASKTGKNCFFALWVRTALTGKIGFFGTVQHIWHENRKSAVLSQKNQSLEGFQRELAE